jgi:hypothetical protein
MTVVQWVVSRGECDTGLTWDPREGSHRANIGQARGCPMCTKPVSRSPFELKLDYPIIGCPGGRS